MGGWGGWRGHEGKEAFVLVVCACIGMLACWRVRSASSSVGKTGRGGGKWGGAGGGLVRVLNSGFGVLAGGVWFEDVLSVSVALVVGTPAECWVESKCFLF